MAVSGRIPREFIDDLLVRVDIVELIDSHVPLKKAGSSYVARCPFHSEKSPSFSVNRNKQFYHCFGCGVGGNAISFLMEFSHLDFVEAIEDLAGFVGVDVPREVTGFQEKRRNYSEIYSLLERVAVFYVEQLRSNPQGKRAIEYLKNRGFGGEIAKTYSLGYAPDEWGLLVSKFDRQLLIDAGMVKEADDGRVYDRFRGRLVFPIKDKRKRVVAFGARVLDDSKPKYLNSPETAVFSKGKELYGLSELLSWNSKPDRVLVVEGYADVLALVQSGIPYSVAVLGTAASKAHMDMLFRFTSEVVFCFDGDKAGDKAAWRAVEESFSSLKDGRQVKIMVLPEGDDPDSLVRKEGVELFEQRIFSAKVLSDYFFETLCSGVDLQTVEGRSILAAKVGPYIDKIPAGFFREMMQGEVDRIIRGVVLDVSANPSTLSYKNNTQEVQSSVVKPEIMVLALLLQNPGMVEIVDELGPDWGRMTFSTKEWLLEILRAIEECRPESTGRLLEVYRGDGDKFERLSRLASKEVIPVGVKGFDDKAEFKGALIRLIELGKRQFDQALMEEKLK